MCNSRIPNRCLCISHLGCALSTCGRPTLGRHYKGESYTPVTYRHWCLHKMHQNSLSIVAVVGILVRSTLSIACSDGDKQCLTSGCSMWCSRWTCKKEGCEGCDEKIGCDPHSPPPPSPPPLPALPPWDAQGVSGALNVFAHEGKLYANGVRLHIKGVNWFGSEGRAGPPVIKLRGRTQTVTLQVGQAGGASCSFCLSERKDEFRVSP